MPSTVKAAAKMWKELPEEEKKTYAQLAASENYDYSKDKQLPTDETMDFEAAGSTRQCAKNTEKILVDRYRGLLNKGNDCWLNTLLQCLNCLPLKNLLTSNEGSCLTPVAFAFMKMLSKLNKDKVQPFYPDILHITFQNQFHYIPGAQNDIHESFTRLVTSGGGKYENIFENHFEGAVQYKKTCTECGNIEYLKPEMFTTIFLALGKGFAKEKIGKHIQESINDDINVFCETCKMETTHYRIGKFVFLPETLAVVFKRFNVADRYENKKQTRVSLTIDIEIEASKKTIPYRLRSCALHHGTRVNNGHYTALVLDRSNTVIEMDDAFIKDVSETWQERSSKTVYLAFYSKNENNDNGVVTSIRDDSKVDPEHISDENGFERKNKPANVHSSEPRADKNENVKEKSKEAKNVNEGNLWNIWDISSRDTVVCQSKDGNELRGRDLKTLELPVTNKSYMLKNPGWLNDNVVNAYLSLLAKTSSNMGIEMFAFDIHIFTMIREVITRRDEKRLYRMISKFHRNEIFELYDCLVIPVNVDGNHWCT